MGSPRNGWTILGVCEFWIAIYLCMGELFVASEISALYIPSQYRYFRLQTKPSCWVDVGRMEGHNGIWCPMWWKGLCTSGSLHRIFVHHMQWRGICLRAIYFQGTN